MPADITPKTKKGLEEALQSARNDLLSRQKTLNEERERRVVAENVAKETHKQFDDLKTRLHDAELTISWFNGYNARVQEDDVVNEPLVLTGDPEAEQRFVPKRKHCPLKTIADPFMESDRDTMSYERNRATRRHWITY